MDKRRKYTFGLLAFLIPLIYLGFLYPDVMQAPNTNLFSAKGDGIKNYYTFAYHIKHDTHGLNFEGMNYPFGEHLVYTDAQPFFSNLLKLLSAVFPFISDYSIGIQNLSILLSFGICALFLFLIFNKLTINKGFACLSASAIALMAPQLFRIPWHQGLAYACVIPVSLYLFILFYEKRSLLRSGLILANNCIWTFIHPYWGLILTALFGVLWVIMGVMEKKRLLINTRNYGSFFLQVFLHLVIFGVILKLTDFHTQRISSPAYFFDFTASWDNTFATPFAPFGSWYNWLFRVDPAHQLLHWEGRSYLGLGTMLVLLVALGQFVRNFLFAKKRTTSSPLVLLLLGTSIILFLLASAFPFNIFPILTDWFPPIKQFRALGRLAWVTYFTAAIFAVYKLQQAAEWLQAQNQKGWSYLLLSAFPILMGIEAYYPHQENATYREGAVNLFSKDVIDKSLPEFSQALQYVNPAEYQAIIPLPYFHIGSEAFGRPDISYDYVRYPFAFSYHTGLPLTGVFMSRTSLDETRASMVFFSRYAQEKHILEQMNDTLPLLILYMKDQPIPWDEKWLINLAIPVYANEILALYNITPAALKNSLPAPEKSQPPVFQNSFDQNHSPLSYAGAGALQLPHKGMQEIFRHNTYSLSKDSTYKLSFWFENSENRCQAILKQGIIENEKIVFKKAYPRLTHTYRIQKNWTRYEILLTREMLNEPFVFYFEGHDRNQVIYLDELQVIPVSN